MFLVFGNDIDTTFVIEAFEKDDMFEGVSAKTVSPGPLVRVHASLTPIPGRG